MLNRMKIKTKLLLCFMLIGLFSIIIGGFSLNELSEANSRTEVLYSGHLVPSSQLTTVQNNLNLIGQNYELMLDEKDVTSAQARVDEINAWTAEDKELLLKYEAVNKTDQELQLYKKLQENLTAYRAIRADLDECLVQNNYTEAEKLLSSFDTAKKPVDESINSLVEENRVAAKAGIDQAKADFNKSRFIMLTVILASLVLSGMLGILIANMFSRPINQLVKAAAKLSAGDVDVDKETQTELKDEIGRLMNAFREMAENIKLQAETAEKIAAGDLAVDITPRSEKDLLGISMGSVVNSLKNLVSEAQEMTRAAVEGQLHKRGDIKKFNGGYKDIINGFNETLEAVVIPLTTSAEYIKKISEGDIPEPITEEYRGEFNEIKNSLNTCISAINSLIDDTNKLSDAAVKGNLSIRADAKRHGGDFSKIIEGLNTTLDTVIEPLTVASESLKMIGKGEIPAKIIANYKGDYNTIKDSINACVDGLGALVEGNEILSRMSKNDYSVTLDGSYVGVYEKMRHRINNVIASVRDTIEIVSDVSEGDLSKLDKLKAAGKKGDNDTLVPSLIKMLENVKMLVEETATISRGAIEGNLDARGDENKFHGEFKEVIIGINNTLEAIVEPVGEALNVLKETSNGNLHSKMTGDYKGTYAEIKTTLNETIDHLKSYVDEISSVLQEIATGNLQQRITANYKGDFVEIKDSLNHIVTALNQVMGGIGESADQVAAGSRQVSDGSQSLAQGATEQASSVEELSASINELASQTKQNAIRANEANDLSNEAKLHAESGNQQMSEMLASMTEINDASANISKVIKVIDDIAFQTNILALNAAVEAARAGAQGKGFSVVAEEVRNLAARSAEAVKETTALIETSINKVTAGTRMANNTAEKLGDIVEKIEKTADLINEIAKASNEQASGIAQIDKGVEQVAKVVQTNSATSEESAAASEELYSQAESLKAMVSGFKTSRK